VCKKQRFGMVNYISMVAKRTGTRLTGVCVSKPSFNTSSTTAKASHKLSTSSFQSAVVTRGKGQWQKYMRSFLTTVVWRSRLNKTVVSSSHSRYDRFMYPYICHLTSDLNNPQQTPTLPQQHILKNPKRLLPSKGPNPAVNLLPQCHL
jgi:hypothetical protein